MCTPTTDLDLPTPNFSKTPNFFTHQQTLEMDMTTSEDYEADFNKAIADLCNVLFANDDPSLPQQPNNPQPIQQVDSFADLIDQHPLPVSPPPVRNLEAADERRRQEEIYQMSIWQSIEARRQLVMWENKYLEQQIHLQQLQRVNDFLLHQQPMDINNGGTRKRKRSEKKNKKTKYMVSASNLLALDKWAWRKYGRKPVKGSPFLRSYYKCTTADGCKAKKHVEKCLVEPEIYLVSYTGEHTHPDPVQRAEPANNNAHNKEPISQEEMEEEELLIPNMMMWDDEELGISFEGLMDFGCDEGSGSGLNEPGF